ncbi:MSMEG_1061 family FMN-dependent PPOX-type flavoprotein [Falsibacillus albus]|uniref:Pyridoxamine 5'-phosphate oxidase family protein n=1 Tax=Falsibacillus albus TaxID=2478915 RepID=A0A3L7K0A8_9BACI|nr:MSMEG_1061 family FMN-dependent PPOX-type flavoprotein [Falsibacillus albus]RLQ96200.1 pyridoxamine 5'-phosphate oxidase family protein [Falsibacillus albus]
MLPFKKIVADHEEAAKIVGKPSEASVKKVIDFLDQHCIDFIEKSPFLIIGTADSNGQHDVSPRGDAPGFAKIYKGRYILIPERPGNRRLDSIHNILETNKAGLIFLIPGMEETLRINGKAWVIYDEDLLDRMKVQEKKPLLAIAIEPEESFIHCAKALKRSKIWEGSSWLDRDQLPTAAKIMASHINSPDKTEEHIRQKLEESYQKRLY